MEIKTQKPNEHIGPRVTDIPCCIQEPHNVVVIILDNLPITEPEKKKKSVFSKGINFVPLSKRTHKFTVNEYRKGTLLC